MHRCTTGWSVLFILWYLASHSALAGQCPLFLTSRPGETRYLTNGDKTIVEFRQSAPGKEPSFVFLQKMFPQPITDLEKATVANSRFLQVRLYFKDGALNFGEIQISLAPGEDQYFLVLDAPAGIIREVTKREETAGHDPKYPRRNLPETFELCFRRPFQSFVGISPSAVETLQAAAAKGIAIEPTDIFLFR